MQIHTEISKIVLHFALFVLFRVRSGYICKRKGRVKIYFYQSLPSSVSDAHFGPISPPHASEISQYILFSDGEHRRLGV